MMFQLWHGYSSLLLLNSTMKKRTEIHEKCQVSKGVNEFTTPHKKDEEAKAAIIAMKNPTLLTGTRGKRPLKYNSIHQRIGEDE